MPHISDYIHDGEFYDELNDESSDLDFYRRQCHHAQGPVLELCCGTGRLTIPIALDGIRIEGVDRSPSMLERARAKSAAAGIDLPLHEADIRDLDLHKQFALVFIPFNSLQCTYGIEDLRRVFETVSRHLEPGGRFVFDVFNPSIRMMFERARGWHLVRRYTDSAGREVEVTEQHHYDAGTQVNQVRWRIVRGGKERLEHLDMRCFYPLEMDALISLFGFRCLLKYGDFDESPFSSDSPKLILACEQSSTP